MPRANPTTQRIGVSATEHIFAKEFGWHFREQFVADFGIDALVEIAESNIPTGTLIGLQIKSGRSYFRKKGTDYVYYGKPRHLEYWTKQPFPLILVLHNPDNNITLWQPVERHRVKNTKNGWSIVVPAQNVLTAACKRSLLNTFWEREANTAAKYIGSHRFSAHRGAFLWTKNWTIVFANDGGQLGHSYVHAFINSLDKELILATATTEDEYTYAIIIDSYDARALFDSIWKCFEVDYLRNGGSASFVKAQRDEAYVQLNSYFEWPVHK